VGHLLLELADVIGLSEAGLAPSIYAFPGLIGAIRPAA
jgi:hypothetical protein